MKAMGAGGGKKNHTLFISLQITEIDYNDLKPESEA